MIKNQTAVDSFRRKEVTDFDYPHHISGLRYGRSDRVLHLQMAGRRVRQRRPAVWSAAWNDKNPLEGATSRGFAFVVAERSAPSLIYIIALSSENATEIFFSKNSLVPANIILFFIVSLT